MQLLEGSKNIDSPAQLDFYGNFLYQVDWQTEVEDIDNDGAALETLNQAGCDLGYFSKKGDPF